MEKTEPVGPACLAEECVDLFAGGGVGVHRAEVEWLSGCRAVGWVQACRLRDEPERRRPGEKPETGNLRPEESYGTTGAGRN